jgi:hypothetical protein
VIIGQFDVLVYQKSCMPNLHDPQHPSPFLF